MAHGGWGGVLFGMKKITHEELVERLELHDRWLKGGEGPRMDLSGMDLRSVDLRSVDLRGANLSRTDLTGANMMQANLSRADLGRADLSQADLSGANMWQADLSGALLTRVNLTRTILVGAILPEGMRAGVSLGYRWVVYGDGRFGFGCETGLVSEWLEGGLAEDLSQEWIGEGWEQFSAEIRRILAA